MKFAYGMAVGVVGAGLLAGCITAPQGGAKVAYYNGAYGEYHGGFWGKDGAFYFYADASQVKIVRDDGVVEDISVTRGPIRVATVHGFVRTADGGWRYNSWRVSATRPRL